jgi:predicted Zn-dependent protease
MSKFFPKSSRELLALGAGLALLTASTLAQGQTSGPSRAQSAGPAATSNDPDSEFDQPPVNAPEQPKVQREYQLTDDSVEALTKYKTATDAKKYDEAVAVIDAQLAKLTDQNGYDYAILLEYKAQALLLKGDYAGAIAPMERGLQISDAHKPTYSDERVTRDLCYYLAQLYYQEGTGKNATPKIMTTYLEKSEAYMKRWLRMTPKPTPEGLLFYASLLYNRATQDADHPDLNLVKRALSVVERGLHMSTHPRDQFYILKLVCLQQLNRNAEAVEMLELLVAQKPENKTYWQQLAGLYLGQDQPIRAIITIERAQAHGIMTAPKDNYNLVGIHFNIGQFGRAAELLDEGLHKGTIESDVKNWELLASSYQQLHRDFKAIDVLEEAAKRFPQESQLEYLIAQNYYSLEKYPEALQHLERCIERGGGNKPEQTNLFMAYIAYELKKYDVALAAANRAIALPGGAENGKHMLKAIKEKIAEREEKMKKT